MTISYGQHPDEVFYLFFGFLPEDNPANSVVLFTSRDDFVLLALEMGLNGFQRGSGSNLSSVPSR